MGIFPSHDGNIQREDDTMTDTTFMAFERVEATTTRSAFWKCTKATTESRQRCEDWVKMPITQSGYTRESVVVELPSNRAVMIWDDAIPDDAFAYKVLRHDLTAKECAA